MSQNHLDEDVVDEVPKETLAVTDEELRTLRRVPHELTWDAFTIALVELCERFTYYGTGQLRMFNSV